MENWQKYNFTDDTGVRKWLGTLSQPVETLDPGFTNALFRPMQILSMHH